MALIATLTGDFGNAAWTNGTNIIANATDTKRLDATIDATITFSNTAANWDLTASSLTWKNEWINPTSIGIGTTWSLELRDAGTATTGYRILRSAAGSWALQKAGVAVGNPWTDLQSRLNPYMRVREAAGTTFLEYSPNGIDWSQPDGTQNTANYAVGGGITTIKPRWQPSAVASSGHLLIQELNGAAVPVIAGQPTIYYMQSTLTAAADAVNVSPAAPTVSGGDLSLLVISGKLTAAATATSTTPSGWTIIGAISQSGTAAANAADTGDTAVVMYYRTDSGYGAPTISTTGFNSMSSNIHVFRSSKVRAGGTWSISTSTSGSDTAAAANLSVTGAGTIDVAAGDLVLAAVAISGDIGTWTAAVIGGMAGATIPTGWTDTYVSHAVTTGNDSRQIISVAPITVGSSAAAPTFTGTNSSTSTGHARFIRIRDVIGARVVASNIHNRARITRAFNW